MRAKTACLALVISAATPFSIAQWDSASAFEAYDTDSSGAVEKSEFLGAIAGISTFRQWDEDGDGKLSEDEFRDVGLDGEFRDWDTDSDTYLDDDEFNLGTFETFDEDGSGNWQAGEWNNADDAGLLDL